MMGRPRVVLDLAPSKPTSFIVDELGPDQHLVVDVGIGAGGDSAVRASLDRLPVDDSAVDLLIGGNTYRDAPDLDVALTELARVLSPSGLGLLGALRGPKGEDWAARFARHGLSGTIVTPASMLGVAMSDWFRLAPKERMWIIRRGNDSTRRFERSALSEASDMLLGRRRVATHAKPQPPASSMSRHDLLAGIHRRLQPRTYVEIGVATGASLALATVPAVGVDPDFNVTVPLSGDITLVRTTSDEFFESPTPFERFGDVPVDLAFVDGMHLAEYAYRDFMNVERHCASTSVVIFDDVLPRSVIEAARLRKTRDWAGDVFKAISVLREVRPDLIVVPVDTAPTGTAIVFGLEPSSRLLFDEYESRLAQLTADDPQVVPEDVLERTDSVDPEALLASPLWDLIRQRRDSGTLDGLAEAIRGEVELLRHRQPAG
jgi:predicted O-methyltransferase YrrM